MAHYTKLDDISINAIFAPYGIKDINSYKILSGGWENTNYLVKTQTGNFVLTICEQKSLQKNNELATLLDYLHQNNFTTSKIVKTLTGQFTTSWENKSIMVKIFLEGKIVEDLSESLLTFIGGEIAQLNTITAPEYISKTLIYGIERFDEVAIYAADSDFYSWLKTTQAYIESYISSDLPVALIHSDVFFNNIIVSEDESRATLMDFEEACHYYRIFDIGMAFIGSCCKDDVLSFNKAKHLLKGYQQKIKLLDEELKALKAFTVYAAVAIAFWRHQNFNYVIVTSELKDHYLSMKNIADNIMSIADEEFIALLTDD